MWNRRNFALGLLIGLIGSAFLFLPGIEPALLYAQLEIISLVLISGFVLVIYRIHYRRQNKIKNRSTK